MVFLPLLLFGVIFVLLHSRQRHLSQVLEALTATVKSVTEALLSNDLARLSAPPATALAGCRFVRELVQQHLYRGELRVDDLRLLQQVISVTHEQQRVRGQLRLLFLTRIGGVIVFSMLGNFLLGQLLATAPHSPYVPIAGSLILASGVLLLEKTMPATWFWQKHSLSAEGQRWTTALLDRRTHALHPVLQQMQQRELTLGISLSAERSAFLNHWQHERNAAETTALKKHQDFFPLLELLVFGSLAALHLSPVLRSLFAMLDA